MRLCYTFPNVAELHKLSVVVKNTGDIVTASVSGTRSLWWRFIIGRYFAFHNRVGNLAFRSGGNVYSMYLPPFPSLPHNRMLEAFLSSIFFKRIIPMAVTIGVTNTCQCHCHHCSALDRSKSRPMMSRDEIQRVLGECIDLGVTNITFTGGEPLLRNDLEQCIASVSPEKAVTQVFTNGLLLTPERAKSLADSGAYGVQISLDSPDPTEHNRFRGRNDAFSAVEYGVQNALRAGLLVGISTYATKQSAMRHDIIRMMALCSRWGVNEVSVFDGIEVGGLRNRKDVLLDQAARRVLLDDCKAANRKHGTKPRVVSQSWTNCGKGFSRLIGCLAANRQFHITAQGDFTPCDFTPLAFGNVRNEPVRTLWEKLLSHPAYRKRTISCRMQDADFRRRYIDTIPEEAELPYYVH
ncbi:MAG: radical SAM protein [Dehalococcoidales bacterium]|nr:radical SAM protein [Dehalococcoidales bacterium]